MDGCGEREGRGRKGVREVYDSLLGTFDPRAVQQDSPLQSLSSVFW